MDDLVILQTIYKIIYGEKEAAEKRIVKVKAKTRDNHVDCVGGVDGD